MGSENGALVVVVVAETTLNEIPDQHCVEVSRLPVQPLILSSGQTEPDGEEHQGQGEHPREHEADSPQVEPDKHTVGWCRTQKEPRPRG